MVHTRSDTPDEVFREGGEECWGVGEGAHPADSGEFIRLDLILVCLFGCWAQNLGNGAMGRKDKAYLARGCHRSYCDCRVLPIASKAFCGCADGTTPPTLSLSI